MEKAMYISPTIHITQKDHVGTHLDSWAVDECGEDAGIDFMIAPFTGIVKKIWTNDANEVWLESKDKVQFADGTIDYMTIMVCHDWDVSNLWVGKEIKQGERFYEEGMKGNATGNHVHMECAKGKFTGSGWHQNNAGYWSINNGKKITECLFISDNYRIIDTDGYKFKNVKDSTDTTEKVDQILHKGSKVKFNGVFRVDGVSGATDTFTCYKLTGTPTHSYHHIPCKDFDECDSNGNICGDQILTVGTYVKNDNTYTVKEIDVPTDSAKLTINGKDVWVFCEPLLEV